MSNFPSIFPPPQRSVVTATRTRRKLQAEMVRSALEAEEKKRRMERENFLLTTVPVTIQAAYEPALHHVSADDHEEGKSYHPPNAVEPPHFIQQSCKSK